MSNVGKWDRWYAELDEAQPYGNTVTYQLGADFLAPCAVVEDWGCGKGWFSHFVSPKRYVGIDGSHSKFADKIVDLCDYRSQVPGIYMRHVLEHNYEWKRILENAVASFTERFVLVTFTPYAEETKEIAYAEDPGVPDISFAKADITPHFEGCAWRDKTLSTATQYGTETIYFVERKSDG